MMRSERISELELLSEKMLFEEEVEALMSIYYLPGECTVVDREVTVKLGIASLSETDPRRHVKVVIYVGEEYPDRIPEFSVIAEDMKRESIIDMKTAVNSACKDLIGQPMLVSIISVIRDELEEKVAAIDASVPAENEEKCVINSGVACHTKGDKWTALLHIDHMRSKTKYCKTLEKWTKDLTLTGRLLFYRRLILLVLQGSGHNIKDFIVRLKTVSIDVDSKGHSCKEKMMSVLSEEPCRSSDKCYRDYRILELSEAAELELVFTEAGLKDMYREYVSNIKGYL